MDKDILKD